MKYELFGMWRMHTTLMTSYAIPLFVAVLSFNTAMAFGNDEYWESGWGQGMKEAVITAGPGNQIYVACNEGFVHGSSSISFSLAGDVPAEEFLFLIFDSGRPERIWLSGGSVPSNCRACAAQFYDIIENLKKHSSVYVLFPNGDGTAFSLNGSNEAIGDCRASF